MINFLQSSKHLDLTSIFQADHLFTSLSRWRNQVFYFLRLKHFPGDREQGGQSSIGQPIQGVQLHRVGL